MLNLVNALVARTRGREEGQTFVEYALVLGGISLLLLAAFAGLDTALETFVDTDIIPKL